MNTIIFPSKRQNVWDTNHALFMGGRMLALCQKFELTCKHSLSMVLVFKSLDEGRTLEESWEIYDESMKCFLGAINNNVKKIERIPNEAMDEIGKAIKARNVICHELLVDTIAVSNDHCFEDFEKKGNYKSRGAALAHYIELGCPAFPQKKYFLDREKLLGYARDIAAGDFWVSKINFEITEKEPFFSTKNEHIKRFEEFVLEGFEYELVPSSKQFKKGILCDED